MKKTILALAVAGLAAGAANAAVVYNQDGTKVELGGSLRLILGDFGQDQRADLRNDGSRLEAKASHELSEGLTGLGGIEIRLDDGKGANEGNGKYKFGETLRVRQAYAGFKFADVGTVTFGRQTTNGDDVSVADYTYTLGGNNNLTDLSEKSIKFRSAEFEGFSFGADYLFGHASKTANFAGQYKSGYGVALFYTTDVADDVTLNLNAGYTKDKLLAEANNTATGQTNSSWRLVSELVSGPAAFAVEYGQTVVKFQGADVSKAKNLIVGAKYQVTDQSKVYGQFQFNKTLDADGDVSAKENVYLVGADYQFNKNVVTFVELGHTKDRLAKTKNTQYGVGLRVFF